jgi:hypothetical protein
MNGLALRRRVPPIVGGRIIVAGLHLHHSRISRRA